MFIFRIIYLYAVVRLCYDKNAYLFQILFLQNDGQREFVVYRRRAFACRLLPEPVGVRGRGCNPQKCSLILFRHFTKMLHGLLIFIQN